MDKRQSTETRPNVTLLLGAEGCSEQKDEPWLREATVAEVELTTDGMEDVPAMTDGTGRPYFWMTVDGSAPDWAYTAAAQNLRMKRLNP